MNQEDDKGKGFQNLKKYLIDKFPELTKLKRKNKMEGRYDGINQPKFTTFYYYDDEVWFIEYDDKDIFSSAKWDVNDKLETFWSLLNDDELFEKLIKDVCDIDLFDKWGKKYNWQFDDMSETLVPRNIRESIFFRRRVDERLLDYEFIEVLDDVSDVVRTPISLSSFKNRVISIFMDSYHGELSDYGRKDFPYDEVFQFLSDKYSEKIEERYNRITNSSRNIRESIKSILREKDPKVGTGKKPKGSDRRLYTDENPKDTVSVKFKTKEDIIDTLNKESFKSKPHKRQSQIINLIHQRVRAAYQNAKDPETKKRLKRGYDYIETVKEKSKRKTIQLQKQEQNESELTEKCWPGYTQKGMKTMFGKRYPNCVKKKKK